MELYVSFASFLFLCYSLGLDVNLFNPLPVFNLRLFISPFLKEKVQWKDMEHFFLKLPWVVIIVLCLTLGLAPYSPPHIWEKFQMLARGHLHRPIDWFDFILHALPWCLLILKGYFSVR